MIYTFNINNKYLSIKHFVNWKVPYSVYSLNLCLSACYMSDAATVLGLLDA